MCPTSCFFLLCLQLACLLLETVSNVSELTCCVLPALPAAAAPLRGERRPLRRRPRQQLDTRTLPHPEKVPPAPALPPSLHICTYSLHTSRTFATCTRPPSLLHICTHSLHTSRTFATCTRQVPLAHLHLLAAHILHIWHTLLPLCTFCTQLLCTFEFASNLSTELGQCGEKWKSLM